MWLLVGLGNPGETYKAHRHNVGFRVIDALAGDHGFPPFRAKFQGSFCEGFIGAHRAVLLKPLTYMNESGESVGKAARFYKIPPERVIVFHDELDLAPLKMRVKHDGGVAGHNGLKSVKAHLRTTRFKRVRIGIGHPGDKDRVSDYVLSDIPKAERDGFEALTGALSVHAGLLLEGEDELYMTRVAEALA